MGRKLGLAAVTQGSVEELVEQCGTFQENREVFTDANGRDCAMEWQAALKRGKWVRTGGNVTAYLGA